MTSSKPAPSRQLSSGKGHGRLFTPSVLALALSSALALPGVAVAADWAGTGSNDWFTMGNWSPAGIPDGTVDVFINSSASNSTAINGGNATAQNVTVGDVAGSNGILVISNAGTLGNGIGVIGNAAGSQGMVTVTGPNSQWTNTTFLSVGVNGTGQMTISNGGTVTSNGVAIGFGAGSSGTVMVDGGTLTSTSSLQIGRNGAGMLTIQNGGTVSSGSFISVADAAGSMGTLTIQGGGVLTSDFGLIGSVQGSTGTVTIDGAGSKWINNGTFSSEVNVGDEGTGTLTISHGGELVTGTSSSIGHEAGSHGTVNVDGVDGNGVASKWTSGSSLYVGSWGNGILNITAGGKVSSFYGYVGSEVGSSGAVTIDGTGSNWTIDQALFVGAEGTGSLTVSNGGTVNSLFGLVGNLQGAAGAVVVKDPGSLWTVTAELQVGGDGVGSLAILNQGEVKSGYSTIGTFPTSTGTATVDGPGSRWTLADDLAVGESGNGTLTIANSGVVSATNGMVYIARATGSTGTLNIGGAAGAPAAAPGVLSATSLQFGDGAGTLNFNHTDTSKNYVFDLPISGLGTINHNAGWTQLTGDSSGFTGLTHVNGGRLAVNGSLANSLVDVNSGGTLGGNGSVGGITARAGAMVAPGNSIGTLNVMGNVMQAAGSIYEVELNAAGQSDLVKATGTATIESGAMLKPVNLGGAPLALGTHYTVLQADGGVTGKYTLTGMAFVGFAASYDLTHVYLDVTKTRSFAEAGLTRNQKAAGAGAESLGSGRPVYEAVLTSATDQAARIAFDQLSGEVHASARGVQLQDSHFMRDASLERLRAMDSERMANDGGADPEEGKPTRLLPSVRDLAYWARAMGSWGHTDGDGNAATVKRDTSGFLMGADTRFGEEGRFGLMGGYSRSAFDVSDRNSSGSSENYHLGAYAGSRFGDLALRTGISYSWHDVSTSRAVAFPGFTDSLKADYKANTTQAFAELGYRINTGMLSEQVALEPFAGLAHVNVSSDGFTERGGAAALASSGSSSGVTFSTLGLRASNSFTLDGGAGVTARGSLGWRHAFGDTAPMSALAFAGGAPFAIAGAPIAKSAAVVEAGLDFKLTNAATLGLSYAGQFGSGLKDHSARIHLNVAF
jgi:outer membrane autotransporter protein